MNTIDGLKIPTSTEELINFFVNEQVKLLDIIRNFDVPAPLKKVYCKEELTKIASMLADTTSIVLDSIINCSDS
jgi:hypothetical protein